MLTSILRHNKKTSPRRREDRAEGSENVAPNLLVEANIDSSTAKPKAELPMIIPEEEEKIIIREKKSCDQSSDWSSQEAGEESDPDDGTEMDGSYSMYHSEYSDAGSSSYACSIGNDTATTTTTRSITTGPLLAKGNIMDWNNATTIIEMDKSKDASILTTTSSSNGTNYYSLPIEEDDSSMNSGFKTASSAAIIPSPPIVQELDNNAVETLDSDAPLASSSSLMKQKPILNSLISVPNHKDISPATIVMTQKKRFCSVAARLFQARKGFSLANYTIEHGEIAPLFHAYQELSNRLKSLVTSVKVYQEANQELHQTRAAFFSDCNELCKDTAKLHQEFVPRMGHYDSTHRSRVQLSQLFGATLVVSNDATSTEILPEQGLLDYVMEWEEIVVADLGQQLSILDKLEQKKSRYEQRSQQLKKWKRITSDHPRISNLFHTKWQRIQVKYQDANQIYKEKEGELVFLLQQVTAHGWKDLYPLVEATLELEIQRMEKEQDSFGQQFPAAVDHVEALLEETISSSWTKNREDLTALQVFQDRSSQPYLFVDEASPYSLQAWITMLEHENDPSHPTGFYLVHVQLSKAGDDPGFCILQQLGVSQTPALVHNRALVSGREKVAEYIGTHFINKDCVVGSLSPPENGVVELCVKMENFFFAWRVGEENRHEIADLWWMSLETALNKTKEGPYLHGDDFSLADIHIFSFLQVLLSSSTNEKVPITSASFFGASSQEWYETVASRPSIQVVFGKHYCNALLHTKQ